MTRCRLVDLASRPEAVAAGSLGVPLRNAVREHGPALDAGILGHFE